LINLTWMTPLMLSISLCPPKLLRSSMNQWPHRPKEICSECRWKRHMVIYFGQSFLCQQNLQAELWTHSDSDFLSLDLEIKMHTQDKIFFLAPR
jgi:hypothetical protein